MITAMTLPPHGGQLTPGRLPALVRGLRLQPLMDIHRNTRVGWEVLTQLAVPAFTESFFSTLSAQESVALFLMQAEMITPRCPGEPLLINLPVRAFLDAAMVDVLLGQGEAFRQRVSFEIQDPTSLSGLSNRVRHQLVVALMALREAGWKLWMDDLTPPVIADVGSLGLVFDGVKTDWHEMRRRCAEPQALQALVRQARHLGQVVLVEGIETEADLQHARASGAAFGQGFLWPEQKITVLSADNAA